MVGVNKIVDLHSHAMRLWGIQWLRHHPTLRWSLFFNRSRLSIIFTVITDDFSAFLVAFFTIL
jgi:hypothetical protein